MYHVNVNANLLEKNVIQINGRIKINVDVSVKKDYIWNHSICNCEYGKYLASNIDNSTIIGEISFNEKNVTCKTQNFFILLTFLLIILLNS